MDTAQSAKYLVLIVREQTPSFWLFDTFSQAFAHFDRASMNWTESFLLRVIRGPGPRQKRPGIDASGRHVLSDIRKLRSGHTNTDESPFLDTERLDLIESALETYEDYDADKARIDSLQNDILDQWRRSSNKKLQKYAAALDTAVRKRLYAPIKLLS